MKEWEDFLKERGEDELKKAEKFNNQYDMYSSPDLDSIKMILSKENEKICYKTTDLNDISYPLLVRFYIEREIAYVGFTTKNIDHYLEVKRRDYSFETYSILKVRENQINDLIAYIRVNDNVCIIQVIYL